MSSFRAYGKLDEADQQRLEARRRTRKRIIIIAISSIVLVSIVVAAVLSTTLAPHDEKPKSQNSQSISESVKAICKVTLYPDSCYSSLSSATNSSQLKPEDIFKLSIQVAMGELSRASKSLSTNGFNGLITDNMTKVALGNCFDLLSLAIDDLNTTLYSSTSTDVSLLEAVDDIKTWLSAAGTYQQICIDGFENATEEIQSMVSNNLKNSTEFTSNSLAIITGISSILSSFKLRRLLTSYPDDCNDGFPKWLSSKDRKLLQASNKQILIDAVVAQDGTGMYQSINDALKQVPDKNSTRFVIYIKTGVYLETVWVGKNKWNVMMIGDGMDATVVSGGLNFVDGTPTYSTATFATFGTGFIARDIGFVNSAGPEKHQAVALMSSSDQTVFYRCRIDAFQDSLYAQAQRQFFRECDIYGTVDFIFGNSAVIFQKCNILPRVPMVGQQNTITAQGKVDPNQNTGIVIHNCNISPSPGGDFKYVKTYLGRPWKSYSTTIIMRSMIDGFINPAGWLPWSPTSPTDTIFYSEYQNYGPGSSTKNRVNWKGVKNNMSSTQATKFTVKPFINGGKWITAAGSPYSSSL